MQDHHFDVSCLCESDRFAHDVSPVAAAAMGRLREHREKIRPVVPFQFGLGWTCMSQTQPLATGSPATSTMKPANRFDFMCVRAQRRYGRSAASRSACGIFAIAFHIPRRCRTRTSKSPRVARRRVPRTTERGFGPGTSLFRICDELTLFKVDFLDLAV